MRSSNREHELTRVRRLEKLVRDTLDAGDHARIQKIVDQLCHDYTYALHQPYARNGGLIGLAAASIALGPVCPCEPARVVVI